jgi:hypothetical protein
MELLMEILALQVTIMESQNFQMAHAILKNPILVLVKERYQVKRKGG